MLYFMYTKAFLLYLIKAWERALKKDGEIGKQTKWNGSTEYEIEKVKQTIKVNDHHVVQLFLSTVAH